MEDPVKNLIDFIIDYIKVYYLNLSRSDQIELLIITTIFFFAYLLIFILMFIGLRAEKIEVKRLKYMPKWKTISFKTKLMMVPD